MGPRLNSVSHSIWLAYPPVASAFTHTYLSLSHTHCHTLSLSPLNSLPISSPVISPPVLLTVVASLSLLRFPAMLCHSNPLSLSPPPLQTAVAQRLRLPLLVLFTLHTLSSSSTAAVASWKREGRLRSPSLPLSGILPPILILMRKCTHASHLSFC